MFILMTLLNHIDRDQLHHWVFFWFFFFVFGFVLFLLFFHSPARVYFQDDNRKNESI